MSGFGTSTTEGGQQFTQVGLSNIGSPLLSILMSDSIVPGSAPSYQLCKDLYTFHFLGAKMAEAPLNMAQSQEREITISAGPETRLIEEFKREWKRLGVVGADVLIHNTMKTARIYGIASIAAGTRGGNQGSPLNLETLHKADLYFNVLDPLNTAGSLVLNQDPNAPDFQKPSQVQAGGRKWHPSRVVTMMNEQPVYIEWSNSAFGFVGRSVYQRALFPLKTAIQSMITDDMVVKKVGLLIAKMKQPGSIANNRMFQMLGFKRQQLQGGMTGNVLTIGETEAIESLNLQNLEGPYKLARDNALKNVATAANMPARMLDQETLVSGFGEGAEDAKQIARYIDRLRIEMGPLYTFFDMIVQRRAWTPEFYETIRAEYSEYADVPYETAFYQWANSFTALWPNLLVEPDSEKIKTEDVRFKAVAAMVEVLAPLVQDPTNKTILAEWAADQTADRRELFTSPLLLDGDAMRAYKPPAAPGGMGGEEEKEPEAQPFAYEE